MTKNSEIAPSKFNVLKVMPDDLNTVYENIYCKNHLIKEDWFDEPFLSADLVYDKNDFLEILEDKNTYSYVAIERIYLKEPNNPGYYYGNERKGFLSFERMAKGWNIVFLETLNDNVEVYTVLLNFLYENTLQSGKESKITWEVKEGRWKQMEGASKAGFKLEKTVHCKDKADVYIYCKEIKKC